MGLKKVHIILPLWFIRLAYKAVLTCSLTVFVLHLAIAQTSNDLTGTFQKNSHAQMLLQADELIYDNDTQTITAQGSVQIEYDGNHLVARKIVYNQRTNRMTAEGNVEIVEHSGNRIYSDNIDITDDFHDGFVNSLHIETVNNTRFAAESAERSNGEMTIFNNGIYTACKPCQNHPEKPALWQIKAPKIVWNGSKKTVYFEHSRFEMFGIPLVYLPSFEMADPTVKRKSGFLFPHFDYKNRLGFGIRNSYFWNLAPNYDLTFSVTPYTQQGFLTEAEWRHRLENGAYNLHIAGIHQLKPNTFDANTVDQENQNRGMIGSKGRFTINPFWTFGWTLSAQTDKNFSQTYNIDGYNAQTLTSELYLTGLNGRNYFDLHFYKFNVQESLLPSNKQEFNSKQPWIVPRINYAYTLPEPVYGGELNFNANLQGIYRKTSDYVTSPYLRIPGIHGSSGRLSAEAEWKRTFMTPGGLVITPLLGLRGDGIGSKINTDSISTMSSVHPEAFRAMATAGVEMRWPILLSTANTTHILEPIAQIFLRNNEGYAGELPNEDAQSFVFDTTTLFQRDKFSGYDRVEGGQRANLGLRYSGYLGSNWTIYGLAGQSYHLGGVNSFATRDFVNVGANSGLETARSDYVAMLGLSQESGGSLAIRGRFDEKNFALRRGEVEAQKSWGNISVSGQYTYIDSQPQYGYSAIRQEITLTGLTKMTDKWGIFGSGSYDLMSKTLARTSSGLAYNDECFTYAITYSQTQSPGQHNPSYGIGFNISFRTLGDYGTSTSAFAQ